MIVTSRGRRREGEKRHLGESCRDQYARTQARVWRVHNRMKADRDRQTGTPAHVPRRRERERESKGGAFRCVYAVKHSTRSVLDERK